MSGPAESEETIQERFFSAPPPEDRDDLEMPDEFAVASLWAPGFTSERLSHLGGPAHRVHPGMPAQVVVIHRQPQQVVTPDPEPTPERSTPAERAAAPAAPSSASDSSALPALMYGVLILLLLGSLYLAVSSTGA